MTTQKSQLKTNSNSNQYISTNVLQLQSRLLSGNQCRYMEQSKTYIALKHHRSCITHCREREKPLLDITRNLFYNLFPPLPQKLTEFSLWMFLWTTSNTHLNYKTYTAHKADSSKSIDLHMLKILFVASCI